MILSDSPKKEIGQRGEREKISDPGAGGIRINDLRNRSLLLYQLRGYNAKLIFILIVCLTYLAVFSLDNGN